MGNKKTKKNKKTKTENQVNSIDLSLVKPSFKGRVKALMFQPINLIVIRFVLAMFLFYVVWATPIFQEHVIKNIAIAYAAVAEVILNLFNYSVLRSEDTVGNGVFSISIKNGCDGVEGCALFICALLIYPSAFSSKLKGIFFGLIFLMLLNLVRIISLYMIGVHIPLLFDVMHESVWQALYIVLSLLTLVYFISKEKEFKTGIKPVSHE